jgi:hypothetical protein
MIVELILDVMLFLTRNVFLNLFLLLIGNAEGLTVSGISSFFDVIGSVIVFIPLDIILTILGAGVAWLGIQFKVALFNFVLKFIPGLH